MRPGGWPRARSPEFRRLGMPVFVDHDRTSSRVFVGAFNSPKAPNVPAMYDEMLKVAGVYNTNRKKTGDPMVVPATALTDADEIKTHLK
jgi:hypothetical protein